MLLDQLDRPLAIFDIEATGLNRVEDRLIDLAVLVLHPGGTRKLHEFRVNPGMPIPAESTEVHGITDTDVKDAPPFAAIIDEVEAVFVGADLAGYNLIHFDIPLLENEYRRLERVFDLEGRRILDAQKIFHKKEPRDLTAALQYYAGEAHTGAHGAAEDVWATLKVIEGQIRMYDDLPKNMEGMDDYCARRDLNWADRIGRLKWVNDKLFINFGRKQGQSVDKLAQDDPGFLRWIIRGDFPQDMKDLVAEVLAKYHKPKPKTSGRGFRANPIADQLSALEDELKPDS